mmetsp:Transcript_14919/g.13392  ORF Transcript_14919/g.13392 Transcript_14919/m.13392 type:complete len:364 (-) Transcript_14919:67-1158(-)
MAEQKNNDKLLESLDEPYVTAPTGGEEKVIFGAKLGDRRQMVLPWNDPRVIMKCIGRVRSDYGKHPISKKPIVKGGTGTVFSVKDNEAFIITCAHNTKTRDYQGNLKDVESLEFRILTENYPYIKSYKAHKVAVHHQYKAEQMDKYDLAILKITDSDGIFQNIFNRRQDQAEQKDGNDDIVHLFCSDEIKSQRLAINYGLYGFPVPKDVHSNKEMKSGNGNQLWGMTAPSRSFHDHNGTRLNMYFRKNDTNELWNYNAIDTEGGQSGAAIFVTLSDGKYGIVGIHTGGSKDDGQNWGVALNGNKIQWINSKIGNQNAPNNTHWKWPQKLQTLIKKFPFKIESEINQALELCNGDINEAANLLT